MGNHNFSFVPQQVMTKKFNDKMITISFVQLSCNYFLLQFIVY